MHYKIKIKSQGSEFSLESNNKEVTQREMDLYFADIFGASDEFKSKIKKVEIVNQNIRSIQDFEENKLPKKDDNAFKKIQTETSNTVKFQNEADFKNDFYPSDQQQEIKSEIKKEEHTTLKEFFANKNTTEENPKTKEDTFIEPFAIASEEEQNNIENIANIQNYEINNEEQNNTNTIAFETIQSTEPELENLNTNKEELNTNKTEIDDLISKAQQSIEAGNDNSVDISSIIPFTNTQEIGANEFDFNKINTFNLNNIQQDSSLNSQTLPIDIKQFIKNCSCQNQEDEMIVCAYFIKYILKESDFTIKYINSKLFQATGNIAGMSVIDELVTKDYIKVININTPKTYSITTQGEICFSELQG